MVEFALVIPLLVALFLGTVFFGYDFYTYNRLEEVIRGGARFASIQKYDAMNGQAPPPCVTQPANEPPTDADYCRVSANDSPLAQNIATYTVFGTSSPQSGQPALVEGLTTAMITVSVRCLRGAPAMISVGIRDYRMSTPAGTITLNKPVTEFPYYGQFVPVPAP